MEQVRCNKTRLEKTINVFYIVNKFHFVKRFFITCTLEMHVLYSKELFQLSNKEPFPY